MQKSAVPARPAPAPPPNRVGTGNPNRYTPTTNWDDSPFDAPTTAGRKVPPPRPPPPRVQPSPIESSGFHSSNNNSNNGGKGKGLSFTKKVTPQSVNILSNLFGSRGGSKGGNTSSGPTLPPPPPVLKKHHQPTTATRVTTVPLHLSSVPRSMSSATNAGLGSELIDWSSPPSSPTLTHKTFNSDCISVDSFSSETHSNSSPQNGSYYSQAESGFEDDFSVHPQPSLYSGYHQDLRKSVSSQISQLDPFSAPPLRAEGPKIRQVPPPIAQNPKIVDQSAFYTQNSISFQAPKPFDDPLSNGKSLIAPPQQNAISMPTIIKPVIMAKPVGVPQKDLRRTGMKRDSSEGEKTPSPPMPIYAPPPPPPEYYAMQEDAMPDLQDDDDGQARESYGIALYDYASEHDGDLSFRENDKIYLVRQENAEWMFGRCKRGCEGLFPMNYIEIKVPLTERLTVNDPGPKATSKTNVPAAVVMAAKKEEPRRCRALYDFNAEAAEDLSITEGEIITVMWEVNAEWLMGRKKNGTEGQFPAAFIEYL